MSNFCLWSSDFSNYSFLSKDHAFNDPNFDSDGKNISPALFWNNPPQKTHSFALTVFDPDAPTGSGFWHWIIVNIPSNIRSLPRNAGDPHGFFVKEIKALQLYNDYGTIGFGGWAPPKHDKAHQYIFCLYALKKDLNIKNINITNAIARFMIQCNKLDCCTLKGFYENK